MWDLGHEKKRQKVEWWQWRSSSVIGGSSNGAGSYERVGVAGQAPEAKESPAAAALEGSSDGEAGGGWQL